MTAFGLVRLQASAALTVCQYREASGKLLAGTSTGEPFEVLEPRDGKLSRAVLRGERGRKAPDLPGAQRTKETMGFSRKIYGGFV